MFDIHTATYVGTYTLALYSPGPGPVQALSEWAIKLDATIFAMARFKVSYCVGR